MWDYIAMGIFMITVAFQILFTDQEPLVDEVLFVELLLANITLILLKIRDK